MARYIDERNTQVTPQGFNAETEKIANTQQDHLSRKAVDGPNQMETTLDMNSERIINLPAPQSDSEPLTLGAGQSILDESTAQANRAEQEADRAEQESNAAAQSAQSASEDAALLQANLDDKQDEINQAAASSIQQMGVKVGEVDTAKNQSIRTINSILGEVRPAFNDAISSLTVTAPFDFTEGGTVTARNQAILWPVEDGGSGSQYRWDGALPKEVPPNSTPDSTGGEGAGAWVDVGQAALRSDLANPDKGAAMVARGVVAVDSIEALLKLPPSARRSDLRYEVKSYHLNTGVGGGSFYYNASRAGENDGGLVFDGFVRNTEGLFATPFWFGLPLQSEDVDYTDQIQVIIEQPLFAFPYNFKASVRHLKLKSGSIGYFYNAELKLLPNTDNLTPVVSMEEQEGGSALEGSTYIGGILNGNRGAESGQGGSGQDGGLHCLRIYSAINVSWHDLHCINGGTDGVYINQRDITSGSGSGVVRGLYMENTLCHNNSRQGMSVITCNEATFLNFTGTGTNGKLPEAGIDIEPNFAGEDTSVTFLGRTTLNSNRGRAFTVNTQPDTKVSIRMDTLHAFGNNDNESLNIAFRFTGDGETEMHFNEIHTDGMVRMGGSYKSKLVGSEIRCESFDVGGGLSADSDIDITVSKVICKCDIDDAAFSIIDPTGKKRVMIGDIDVENLSSSTATYALRVDGTNAHLDLGVSRASTPNSSRRSVRLDGDLKNTRVKVDIDEQSPEGSIAIIGNNLANLSALKTVSDGRLFIRIFGVNNAVNATWNEFNAPIIHIESGATKNKITANGQGGSSAAISSNLNVEGNIFTACALSSSEDLISGAANNTFIGCFPLELNTPLNAESGDEPA